MQADSGAWGYVNYPYAAAAYTPRRAASIPRTGRRASAPEGRYAYLDLELPGPRARAQLYTAITFTTFGGFGEGTHELIKEVTKDTDWSLNDPWVKPNPKSHAYLTFGFALARANARMLLHADSRRRSAKNRVRTTRPQPATS